MRKKLLLLFAVIASSVTVSAEDYILYTSSDGKVVTPYKTDVFGAKIVSNTYKDGQGKILFDGDVTSIGEEAFFTRSKLTTIVIPNSVTEIGESAFNECDNLRSLNIPKSVTSIGEYAFSDCSITSIEIPNAVTTIGKDAFSYCTSLKSIVIPNSVTSIESSTFSNCTSLTSVKIGSSVASIGWYAFEDCTKLTEIISLSTTPPTVSNSNTFSNVRKSACIIKVPSSSSVAAYKAAANWKSFSNIVPLSYSLVDGEAYTGTTTVPGITVTYTREFSNTKWQPLYVPFSMDYDEWADWAEIAEINDVHQFFGAEESTVIEFCTLTGGSTRANTPYVIRAKATGTVEKTFSSRTLYAAANGSVDCSSAHWLYTLTGVYEPYNGMNGKYALNVNTGQFTRGTSNVNTLRPQRFYLDITPRDGGYGYPDGQQAGAPARIQLMVDGEVTGIEAIEGMLNPECRMQDGAFNLAGQRVDENYKGIIIINDKKILKR